MIKDPHGFRVRSSTLFYPRLEMLAGLFREGAVADARNNYKAVKVLLAKP